MEKNKRNKFLFFGVSIEAQSKENSQRLEQLEVFLKVLLNCSTFKFIASIIHDKDLREDNTPRLAHLHAFIEFAEKKTVLQVLGFLSELLSVDKLLISVEGSNNEFLLVQYLTHKNQPNKHQYSLEAVFSNNRELLEKRYNNVYEDNKAKELEAIKRAPTLWSLASEMGLDFAKRYQGIFNQFKREEKQDFEGLLSQHNFLRDTFERLIGDLELLFHKLDFRVNDTQLRAELQLEQWLKDIDRLKQLVYN